ncbi:MAG: type II secretion system protein [Sulfuricurvum sp.]|uniref:type II secretion system protein n=2 Tax=Sulfuricurvum sp. TaxID=2025608 RepID=UPI002732C7BA|nr:type II secretion system protein [Sulfuricurvum sp.]MDP3291726.1 type II secretion system protein [Sulfuricurvum sp.]
MKRFAFTMIELVFVIVVLGILAAIAIPRFSATRDDAQIAKGRSDISAIRAAIVSERQTRLLQGQTAYINHLDSLAGASADGNILFDNNGTVSNTLLQYGITAASTNGHWRKTAADTYQYRALGVDTQFTYTQATGRFDCVANAGNCNLLTR